MAWRADIFVDDECSSVLRPSEPLYKFIFDKIPARWAGCNLALENATKISALRAMGHNLS